MPTKIAWFVALGLVLAACTGTPEPLTLATSPTTTPAAPTTSAPTAEPTTTTAEATTTTVPGTLSLLNGTPVQDPTLLDRHVLAVKMDNHPKATPQSGVEFADAVIELRVEGITRFITLWHESDADYLGPMRSGRPTDAHLLPAFNEPTFAISGAQAWVQGLIRSQDIHLIGEVHPASFRIPERSAPHNLYVDTNLLREVAANRGHSNEPPAGPIWEFGPMPDSAEEVTSVTMDFRGNIVTWDWHPVISSWRRTAYGEESKTRTQEGRESRIRVPVLVALYVEQYTATPRSGVAGTALPSSEVTGEGKAFVFADGKVVEGTWTRETDTDWFTLTDVNGEFLLVPPGKVWISLVPNTTGLTYE